MTKIFDLTLPADPRPRTRTVPLELPEGLFTGLVYDFAHDSMAGTYIDFPGHIAETDDGLDASNYPAADLFQLRARVIHLNRQDRSGAVTAGQLQAALGRTAESCRRCPAVIVNALGSKRFDQIASRSVYLGADAVEWLISLGIRMVVSDIYESNDRPQSVFLRFFKAGVSTVCCPIDLDVLPQDVTLTVLFPRFPGVTQLPCRVIAQSIDCENERESRHARST